MDEIRALILAGDFDKATALVKDVPAQNIHDDLLMTAYKSESLCTYAFACRLLMEHESVESHYLISELLTGPLCHITGAYHVALHHARKAAALAPDDTSLMEHLLFFQRVPGQLLSRAEAEDIARNIIAKDPSNISARRVLYDEL